MPRREVKPEDIHESPTGLFFTEAYQEGKKSRIRVINLNSFKDLVHRARKTGSILVVTYPNSLFSCDAWLARFIEAAPVPPPLLPEPGC